MERKLPSYNVTNILRRRDTIAALFAEHTAIDADGLHGIVKRIKPMLPSAAPLDSLYASCEYLLDDELTTENINMLAWRLAGNTRRLGNGHPVLPWSAIAVDEWMPAQVLRVDAAYSPRGKPGGEFTLKFLAGQACPKEIVQFWPVSYCHMLASRLGFTRFTRSKYPFTSILEFTNLRLLLLVVADKLEITFEEVAVTSGLVNWNQQYIHMRARLDPAFKCPRRWPTEKPCYRCFWGEDACPAAVRPNTLIKQNCLQCGFTKYFDPLNTECCAGCHQKNLRSAD